MNRDGYRDQIVTHDVGVSLHSKTHPLFMKYSNGTSSVMHITIRACFLCFFYNPYMSLFNSKNFSFTCKLYNVLNCSMSFCTCIFQHLYGLVPGTSIIAYAAQVQRSSLHVHVEPGDRNKSLNKLTLPIQGLIQN